MNEERHGDSGDGEAMGRGAQRLPFLRLLPLVLAVAVLFVAWSQGWHRLLTLDEIAAHRMALQETVAANQGKAILLFIAIYVAAIAVSLPVSAALTITGGFLFGWLAGAAAALVGATAGATLTFLIARSAVGQSLRRRLAGRFDTLASGFERNAFTYLLALRLAPIFPFFIINVVPALFRVRLVDYVGATFLGIIPGALAYAWLGRGLDSVIEAAAGEEITPSDLVTPEILIAFAALGIVALLPGIVKRLRGGRLTEASRPKTGGP